MIWNTRFRFIVIFALFSGLVCLSVIPTELPAVDKGEIQTALLTQLRCCEVGI